MLISLLSTIAILVGLAGTLPQIATMRRNRSAGGQSPLAWMLGIGVNLMMGYVNFVGFGAALLAAGNLVGGALCATALAVVLRYRNAHDVAASALPAVVLTDMPTGEFHALRMDFAAEEQRRLERRRDRLARELAAEQHPTLVAPSPEVVDEIARRAARRAASRVRRGLETLRAA